MTPVELLMTMKSDMLVAEKERGLLLVARMGRYADDSEKEAALLLTAARRSISVLDRVTAELSPEAIEILMILTAGTLQSQLKAIFSVGNISAARLVYCDLLESAQSENTSKAMNCLKKWLPHEALCHLNKGPLTEDIIDNLFRTKLTADVNP